MQSKAITSPFAPAGGTDRQSVALIYTGAPPKSNLTHVRILLIILHRLMQYITVEFLRITLAQAAVINCNSNTLVWLSDISFDNVMRGSQGNTAGR